MSIGGWCLGRRQGDVKSSSWRGMFVLTCSILLQYCAPVLVLVTLLCVHNRCTLKEYWTSSRPVHTVARVHVEGCLSGQAGRW